MKQILSTEVKREIRNCQLLIYIGIIMSSTAGSKILWLGE